MNIEELLINKDNEEICLSVLRKDNDFYVALVRYFPMHTPIKKIIDYTKSDVIILTKNGNMELYPLNYADRVEKVLDDWDIHKFDKQYEKYIEEYGFSLSFLETPNICDIFKVSNDVYEFKMKYREEFERKVRKFLDINDIEPLWIKDKE